VAASNNLKLYQQQTPSAAAPLLDRQGWSTLLAGALLLLISLTTSDSDDNLSLLDKLPVHDQV
jgi:hypothetical protein